MKFWNRLSAVAALAAVLAVPFAAAGAQEHAVGGLRISDETGAAVGTLPAPPGEKYFHLDAGTTTYFVAFDFTGTTPTDVQLRVLGPMGTVLFQDETTYEQPGVQVVRIDSSVPLEDNEYVVNAYIGPEWYLADSLQLAVGEAQIPGAQADVEGTAPAPAQATMVPLTPEATAEQTTVPGGPPRGVLVVAGILILVLAAIVVWAIASALRRR